jgi:hypothetical protein
MSVLKSINLLLPNNHSWFSEPFLNFLSPLGKRRNDQISFTPSNSAYLPEITLTTASVPNARAIFNLSEKSLEIEISNRTGQERTSPEIYQPIHLEEFLKRIELLELQRLDHVGFNLPWFTGVHPDVLKLRNVLAEQSAYYLFPTGQAWDFILPATENEILTNDIDLSKNRYPKFEIVSFEKSSMPLIQIDLSVRTRFEELKILFPEGIIDQDLKNIWVYLTNPYGIDICVVIGEKRNGDWSDFFSGHRLLAGETPNNKDSSVF